MLILQKGNFKLFKLNQDIIALVNDQTLVDVLLDIEKAIRKLATIKKGDENQ